MFFIYMMTRHLAIPSEEIYMNYKNLGIEAAKTQTYSKPDNEAHHLDLRSGKHQSSSSLLQKGSPLPVGPAHHPGSSQLFTTHRQPWCPSCWAHSPHSRALHPLEGNTIVMSTAGDDVMYLALQEGRFSCLCLKRTGNITICERNNYLDVLQGSRPGGNPCEPEPAAAPCSCSICLSTGLWSFWHSHTSGKGKNLLLWSDLWPQQRDASKWIWLELQSLQVAWWQCTASWLCWNSTCRAAQGWAMRGLWAKLEPWSWQRMWSWVGSRDWRDREGVSSKQSWVCWAFSFQWKNRRRWEEITIFTEVMMEYSSINGGENTAN